MRSHADNGRPPPSLAQPNAATRLLARPIETIATTTIGANATTTISNNAASYFGAGTAAEPDAPPRLGKLPFV